MKTKAAVVFEIGKPIEIVELEVPKPGPGEVLVRYTHAGLCHSDVHIAHGDLEARLPMVLGHEGAGVVEEVGPGVTRVKAGDHIVAAFLPTCGTCRWCSTGHQPLCDMGASILEGHLPSGKWPFTGPGPERNYGSMCMVGSFSQYGLLDEHATVKIDQSFPLDKAALVGCGVPTGWGSAVNTAAVRPGETVIVSGIGGIGINAIQGARMAGAQPLIAVDPLTNKRDAALKLGATHAVATMAEAAEIARSVTNGNGADKAIITAGLVTEEIISETFDAVGKAGTMVITGLNQLANRNIVLPSAVLTLWNKSIKGSLFGECSPTRDIPHLLNLYQTGELKVEELITRTYSLEQINQGYDDLLNGENIRGVLVHDPA
ncbi:dehydrogenase [Rhodococcus ruber BKS 20-38]|uniref:alcohol dehydrogenase n=1 Tax=Rhodococcus ruber BKS 20-38 TaxID=1278076 RepID=M2YRV2_9NOCA|nr:NDMA-dependent alcohol dehydrogenase [Rhodococcus ruber]EME51523.1 dehydrogenase [Rhodococcus ruber BKS 20-38]